jgi:hypothetical protein
VIVETSRYSSELVLTNWSSEKKMLNLEFASDSIQSPDHLSSIQLELQAGQQQLIPEIVQYYRQHGSRTPLIGDSIAGPVFASVEGGDCQGIFMAARTATLGSRYGVFYSAVPNGSTLSNMVWIYGLQQNEENRTNIAIVNTGLVDSSDSAFNVELYDGATGNLVDLPSSITLPARGWRQINAILPPALREGYARVVRVSGNNPFIAYAVINDGAAPGERTGDGAFIASSP